MRSRFGFCSVLLLTGLAACGGSSTETDGGTAGNAGGHSGTLGRGGTVGTGGGTAGKPGSGGAGGIPVIAGSGGSSVGGTAGTTIEGTGGEGTGGAGTAGEGAGGASTGGAAGGHGGVTAGTGGSGAVGPMGGHGGMAEGTGGHAGVGGGFGGRGGAGARGGMAGGGGRPGMGGAGGAPCAGGTHRCGTTCVANNSIESGCTANGCQACRDTTNGDPVCRGNTCDISCQSQFHGCGTAGTRTCVQDNNMSNTSCGNTCMACPTMTGGTSTCDGTKCVPRCNEGFHLCNGTCVANSNPMMCGPDDGDCRPCPTGETCTAGGSCQTTSCAAPNQHVCGNMCVDESTTQCGAGCTPCPAPTADKNSVATCTTTGTCRNVCKSTSYHQCGGTDTDPICKSNNDVASCGSSCNACSPAVLDNGIVGCSGTGCTFTCDNGFHKCTLDTTGTPVCLSNTSNDSCGNRCIPCPDSTMCVNGACVPSGAGGAGGAG